jgi:hypothetical protein
MQDDDQEVQKWELGKIKLGQRSNMEIVLGKEPEIKVPKSLDFPSTIFLISACYNTAINNQRGY